MGNSTMQDYATTLQGVSASTNRRLTDVRNDNEVSIIGPSCPQTTVVGAYVVGAVGGGISTLIGLACAWAYATGRGGALANAQVKHNAISPGYECLDSSVTDKRSLMPASLVKK